MRFPGRLFLILLSLLLAAPVLGGPSGKDIHAEMLATIGPYDDPELTAYLDGTAIGTVDSGTYAVPDASNISFGLPNRNGFNGAFISMAIGGGMTSAITNPLHGELMQAIRGANVVMGHDAECTEWIRANRPAPAEGSRRRRRATSASSAVKVPA